MLHGQALSFVWPNTSTNKMKVQHVRLVIIMAGGEHSYIGSEYRPITNLDSSFAIQMAMLTNPTVLSDLYVFAKVKCG